MDIAALSTGISQASLNQSVSIALTKKTMDMAQQNASQMVQMLQAPHPTLGKSIDVKA
ncbi:YjfB family protein [Domibacillus sp. 8LH]|uniref:YjfB family protein n=1 Tax=unclassified Domibacillus TaxID=2632383 RepID=UPI001F55DD03|nr:MULTISPECIES: YjfB family protein [unclassified Domibacillus]MCI2252779.1 YjfB family protein [Domibacillus sp. PGB-M46]